MSVSAVRDDIGPDRKRDPEDAMSDRVRGVSYVSATLACVAVTAIALPLSRTLDLANVVMLYPLAVMLVAYSLGRGPAVFAAFASVALFDFFLVPPYYTFAVADVQYLLTFAVMLAVALVTAQLTSRLRLQAQAAVRGEQRMHALYDTACALAGAHTLEEVEQTVRGMAARAVGARTLMLVAGTGDELVPVGPPHAEVALDASMAKLARGGPGFADIDPPHAVRYEPMRAGGADCGVLAFVVAEDAADRLGESVELLEAVASLAAVAVQRVREAGAAT